MNYHTYEMIIIAEWAYYREITLGPMFPRVHKYSLIYPSMNRSAKSAAYRFPINSHLTLEPLGRRGRLPYLSEYNFHACPWKCRLLHPLPPRVPYIIIFEAYNIFHILLAYQILIHNHENCPYVEYSLFSCGGICQDIGSNLRTVWVGLVLYWFSTNGVVPRVLSPWEGALLLRSYGYVLPLDLHSNIAF